MWRVVSSQAVTFVWLKENKRKQKSLEALMNARLDTGEVLMINIAHVFSGSRKKKNQRLEDKNNKRHSY